MLKLNQINDLSLFLYSGVRVVFAKPKMLIKNHQAMHHLLRANGPVGQK